MDNAPGSSAAPEQPLPHDPSATTRRRLVRRTEGRVIGGVAGGLADHLGLDPAIFRIVFIALAVMGGFGIVAYFVAWLVLPEASDTDGFMERTIRKVKSSRFLPFLLIGIAVVVLLDTTSSDSSPLIWAVALVAAGVVLLRDDPIFTRGTSATGDRPVAPPTETDALAVAATVDAPRAPKRPRSPLMLYTLGATLVVLALMAAFSALDVFEPRPADYFGIALACVGAGVVASAWWGRSILLKLLGVALIPPLLVASIVEVPITGRIGGRYMIAVEDDPSGRYETLIGTTTFDLSSYGFGDEPVVIDASQVVGAVDLYIPPGVSLRLDAAVDAGAISVFGQERGGTDLSREGTFRRDGSSEGQVILKVRGGFAFVNVIDAFWIEEALAEERQQKEIQEQRERDLAEQERIDRRQRRERREERRDRG